MRIGIGSEAVQSAAALEHQPAPARPSPVDVVATPAGLREIRSYADGVGLHKDLIIPRDAAGFLKQPTAVVKDAHKVGLAVHSWTFRNENSFLPADFRSSADPAAYGRAFEEYDVFYKTGIDGLFADNPDTAIEAKFKR